MVGLLVNNELESIRKEAIGANGHCTQAFFWMDWWKLRRPSVRVAGTPAEIRTEQLPNGSLERYRCTNQLGLELKKNIVAGRPVTR
jgi:hypothetical protein